MAGGCGLWQEAAGHCDAVVGSSVVASFVGSGVDAAVGCSGRWQRWRRMNRLVVEGRLEGTGGGFVIRCHCGRLVDLCGGWSMKSSKKFITFVFLIIY